MGHTFSVNVDFIVARRFSDHEFVFVQRGRIIDQRPVVILHEPVCIGKLQLALDCAYKARHVERLAPFGRGQRPLDRGSILLDGLGECRTFGLLDHREHRRFQADVHVARHGNLNLSAIGFAHG